MIKGMKAILIFLIFAAAFMIVVGVYEQKLDHARSEKKIEYRFIPRTYLEDQFARDNNVSEKMPNLFNGESPWFDRTIGSLIEPETGMTGNKK